MRDPQYVTEMVNPIFANCRIDEVGYQL
jgi:hypothetical protein